MNTQVTPEFRPHVANIDGQIKTTSIKVAEHFGKRHDNVIKAIKALDCSPEFYALNFEEIQIDIDLGMGRTRKSPAYEITKDGFVFLAMGFTGKEAAKWKEAYITAFNAMERELLQPHSNLSLDVPDYLKQSRDLLSDYADDCIAAVESTGAKAPKFPVLADGVIDGLIAEKIRHTRLLVSFGADFELQLEQVPRQSCVIDPENLKSVKTVLNEFVPIELMPEILEATSQRITRHFKYLERTTAPAKEVLSPVIALAAKAPSAPLSLVGQFIEDWRGKNTAVINAPFAPCLSTQVLRLFHVWAQNKGVAVRLGDNRIMSGLNQYQGLYSKRVRISRSSNSNPRTVLMIDDIAQPAGIESIDWLADCIDKMEDALNWMEIP